MKAWNSILSKSLAVIVISSVFTAQTLVQAAEDRIEKSFNVQPGGRMVLDADRGSVDVRGEDTDTVRVEVERKASWTSGSKAAQVLKDHVVEFLQQGDTVEIKSRSPKAASGWSFSRGNLQVKFRITVPTRFNVAAKTAGGSVQVAQVEGAVDCGTSGGSLSFEAIRGQLDGHTSGGSIKVNECEGPTKVRTSGGGIQLAAVRGEVTAGTSGGSISAKDIVGNAVLKTSGGGINIDNVQGTVDARTSGGSIHGTFAEGPTADCYLGTSGGGITVQVPADAELEVDAQTSGGGVSSDLPVTTTVQGDQKRGHLHGKINGGGPKMTARTSGGSIRLKKVG